MTKNRPNAGVFQKMVYLKMMSFLSMVNKWLPLYFWGSPSLGWLLQPESRPVHPLPASPWRDVVGSQNSASPVLSGSNGPRLRGGGLLKMGDNKQLMQGVSCSKMVD